MVIVKWVSRKVEDLDAIDKVALILIACVHVFMLITLWLNMGYFYLDNPALNDIADQPVFYAWFTPQTRFTPITYMIAAIARRILGNDPAYLFVGQYLYFLLGTIVLYSFLRIFGLRAKYAVLTVSFLFLWSSAAENIFTVSKAEISLVVALIIFALICWKILQKEKAGFSWWVAYVIAVFLCALSKETWFVIVIPLGVLVLYTRIFSSKLFGITVKMLLGFGLVYILIKIYDYYYLIPNPYMEEYKITITSVISSFVQYACGQPDIFVLGAITLTCCLWIVYKNRDIKAGFLLAMNLGGWAYICGLCFWRMCVSYYMYPAIAFFTISFPAVLMLPLSKKKMCLCSLLGIVACYSLHINYLVAISHIDLGEAYTRGSNAITENVQDGHRVLMENVYYFVEEVSHTQRLQNRNGKNVEIIGAYQSIYNSFPGEDTLALWGTNIEDYNQHYKEAMPQEGDYIYYMVNSRNFPGNVRGVNPANSGFQSKLVADSSGYELKLVDKFIEKKNVLNLKHGLPFKDTFYSGYILYQVVSSSYRVEGLSEDGWSGESLTIDDYQIGNNLVLQFGESFLYMLGESSDNTVEVYIDGEHFEDIPIQGAGGDSLSLDELLRKKGNIIEEDKHTIELKIQKVASPADYGQPDHRTLGVLVTLSDSN